MTFPLPLTHAVLLAVAVLAVGLLGIAWGLVEVVRAVGEAWRGRERR